MFGSRETALGTQLRGDYLGMSMVAFLATCCGLHRSSDDNTTAAAARRIFAHTDEREMGMDRAARLYLHFGHLIRWVSRRRYEICCGMAKV